MIEEFGSFSLDELSVGVPFPSASGTGIWYDPSRDIAWLMLSEMVEVRPVSVWLGEDPRMHAAAHMDQDGRILSVAIGEASRHLPPYVMLAGEHHEVRLVSNAKQDMLQVLLCEDIDETATSALTMVSEAVDASLHFVRDPASMLVAVVVDPASKLAHPSVLPWIE
jgi:uncharacterized protein YuzE